MTEKFHNKKLQRQKIKCEKIILGKEFENKTTTGKIYAVFQRKIPNNYSRKLKEK